MKKQFISLLFCLISLSSFCQQEKQSILKPYKVGFLYNYGTEENFIFDDADYSYSTNTYKGQAFYTLGNWRKIEFELIIQPQVQFLKHQLLNISYITPDQDNVLEKIDEFSQLKKMNLYALEYGFAAKRKLLKKLEAQATISLGFSYIDTRSERLASGFTFIENFSLGLSYNIYNNSHLYLGTNFGHVSNLNFQKPNDGYNILGLEIGYSIEL